MAALTTVMFVDDKSRRGFFCLRLGNETEAAYVADCAVNGFTTVAGGRVWYVEPSDQTVILCENQDRYDFAPSAHCRHVTRDAAIAAQRAAWDGFEIPSDAG